jgi:hypothetical protein
VLTHKNVLATITALQTYVHTVSAPRAVLSSLLLKRAVNPTRWLESRPWPDWRDSSQGRFISCLSLPGHPYPCIRLGCSSYDL